MEKLLVVKGVIKVDVTATLTLPAPIEVRLDGPTRSNHVEVRMRLADGRMYAGLLQEVK